jgi:hypothetical protein
LTVTLVLRMAASMYEKIIKLIQRPPEARTTMECMELVNWLKGKSRLFATVKYGK